MSIATGKTRNVELIFLKHQHFQDFKMFDIFIIHPPKHTIFTTMKTKLLEARTTISTTPRAALTCPAF